MSHQYASGLVILVSALAPLFGFEVANSEVLTNNILNVVTVAAALWAIYRRVSVGDISWTGLRKS